MSRFTTLRRVAVAALFAAAGPTVAQTVPPAAPCVIAPECPPAATLLFPGAPPPGAPQTGQPPAAADPSAAAPAAESSPSFASTLAGAGVGESAALALGGYIDNAVPVTMFRLRYDAAWGNNRPDRAEFFYAKCGCFRGLTPPQLDAHGPPLPEKRVDYQDVTPYFEYALDPRVSVFASIPVRFLNPQVNANTSGLADVDFGAKYALLYSPARVLTFQLRAIAPSGSTVDGLGTGNWWVEPGLLYYRQIDPRWQVFGELRDQIPVARQSNFTGNVLRYGVGTAYYAYQGPGGYVAPVIETVGWTVLSGREATEGPDVSARGDTIVNGKFGVRIGFGPPGPGGPYPARNDIYIGYGRALTGEVWYKNLFRLEYRRFF